MKTKSKWQKFAVGWISALLLLGCASTKEKEICANEIDEPISVCRARQRCEDEKRQIGVGLGFGVGNFGFGVGRGASSARYEACLERDLEEQRSKIQRNSPNVPPNLSPSS